MTIEQINDAIRKAIIGSSRAAFGIEPTQIAAEIPPKPELGDVAFPVAFELAKAIKNASGEKKNPRDIAVALVNGVSAVPGVGNVEIAGAGYLNVFYERGQFLAANAAAEPLPGRMLRVKRPPRRYVSSILPSIQIKLLISATFEIRSLATPLREFSERAARPSRYRTI